MTKNVNINEYLKLITSEFSSKKKFVEYVKSFIEKVNDTTILLDNFNSAFDINEAKGKQLDKIAELVGIKRIDVVAFYDGTTSQIEITDELFRKVVKAKIYGDTWDGTIEGLKSIIERTFPGINYEISDDQDLSCMIYIINPNLSDEEIGLLFGGYILPNPVGINFHYTIVESVLFGWDSNSDLVKGWDIGKWGSK